MEFSRIVCRHLSHPVKQFVQRSRACVQNEARRVICNCVGGCRVKVKFVNPGDGDILAPGHQLDADVRVDI